MNKDFGVPEIYEYEAKGNLKTIYNDIQVVLKVPIVNFVFRTLAFYETLLTSAWHQVRLNMLTIEMERVAGELRYPEISLNVDTKGNWINEYDSSTIEQIKRIVFTFNYVNPKLLLIVSVWAESLSNRPIKGNGNYDGFITPGIIHGLPNIHLVKLNQTTPAIQCLLMDIMKKHHAYDAASDYRALGNYPEFLSECWRKLKPYVGSDEYNVLQAKLKAKAIQLVHERMPFPVAISNDFIYQFYSPREIAGIMGIIAMFQDILPSLIIEGEFFRRMLN